MTVLSFFCFVVIFNFFTDANVLGKSAGVSRQRSSSCLPREIFILSGSVNGTRAPPFNDKDRLYRDEVIKFIAIRASHRLDAIITSTSRGQNFEHGGSGGDYKQLDLAPGETITFVKICSASTKKFGTVTVHYIYLSTSNSNILSGGIENGSCKEFVYGSSDVVVGFYGYTGKEVDGLGVLHRKAIC